MLKRKQQHNSTALHEANFAKLDRVVPNLRELQGHICVSGPNGSKLELQVHETSKYTKTFSLHLKQEAATHPFLSSLQIKIRNYYDARVTEVLAFQRQHRLNPRYNYPNPKMYQPDEKWQTNQFLGEWLDHCLKIRCLFQGEIELLDA